MQHFNPALWRVAQAFDLAGANKIVGAPSFAHFAKGGIVERMRDVVAQPQKLCRQHRYPPLQKTQGRGTLTIDGARNIIKGWASPPANSSTFSPFPNCCALEHHHPAFRPASPIYARGTMPL